MNEPTQTGKVFVSQSTAGKPIFHGIPLPPPDHATVIINALSHAVESMTRAMESLPNKECGQMAVEITELGKLITQIAVRSYSETKAIQ